MESIETVSPEAVSATISRALANARARGEPWSGLAEQHLGRAEELLKRTDALGLPKARKVAEVAAEVDVMDARINALIDALAEALWEMNGRDTQDPLVSILSPGTASYFFEWSAGHPCDRVEAIVELLDPYVAPGSVGGAALLGVQGLLPEYRALCDRMRALQGGVEVLAQMRKSFARLGHVQYSRLRRRMRADGLDPAEIREVFPDVPGQTSTTTFA